MFVGSGQSCFTCHRKTKSNLEPCQTSMIEVFCKKKVFLLKNIDYYIKNVRHQIVWKGPKFTVIGHFKLSSPVGIYLLKVYKRNTRARCEIYSKLTIKTPERRH